MWPFERERSLSEMHLNILKKQFEEFKQAVAERYGVTNITEAIQVPGLVYEIEQVEKFLPKIEPMILLGNGIDEVDLEVYVRSLDLSLREIKEMAESIDAEFNFSDSEEE